MFKDCGKQEEIKERQRFKRYRLGLVPGTGQINWDHYRIEKLMEKRKNEIPPEEGRPRRGLLEQE